MFSVLCEYQRWNASAGAHCYSRQVCRQQHTPVESTVFNRGLCFIFFTLSPAAALASLRYSARAFTASNCPCGTSFPALLSRAVVTLQQMSVGQLRGGEAGREAVGDAAAGSAGNHDERQLHTVHAPPPPPPPSLPLSSDANMAGRLWCCLRPCARRLSSPSPSCAGYCPAAAAATRPVF